MLDLKDVFYFVQVVDRGGFTAAGQSLRLPKSTLSHRVQELEGALGVRLINRTSRQFAMTEVGAEFYQYAVALLQSAEVAEGAVRHRLAEPSGVVHITTAAEIAQFALRDLVQRAIASVPWFLFAGREYLERAKVPAHPQDLARHATISMVRSGPIQWSLRGPDQQQVTVAIEPRFQSNNLVTLKQAACANLGIAALPGYICRAELQAGALRQILPGWMAADARISALMPYRTGLLPAVRSLVDFLASEIPKVTAFDPG